MVLTHGRSLNTLLSFQDSLTKHYFINKMLMESKKPPEEPAGWPGDVAAQGKAALIFRQQERKNFMQGTQWLRKKDLRALPEPCTEGLPHLLLEKVKIAQNRRCLTQSELAETAGLASAWRKRFLLGKGERSGEHCHGGHLWEQSIDVPTAETVGSKGPANHRSNWVGKDPQVHWAHLLMTQWLSNSYRVYILWIYAAQDRAMLPAPSQHWPL